MQWDTLSMLHVRAVDVERQREHRDRAALRALRDVIRRAGPPTGPKASPHARPVMPQPATGGCESRPSPRGARPDARTA